MSLYTTQSNEYPQTMKNALVKFSGGMNEPEEVLVGAGTTGADLLKHFELNRHDHVISWRTPNMFLDPDELLFPKIQNGDLLFISSKVDAGN